MTKSVPRDTKKAVSKIDQADVASPAKEEVEDVVVDEPEVEVKPQEQLPAKSDAEIEAEKISDAQIAKYWKGIEKLRRAPRVHQQDLMLSEKVLRYFDVSSQYGVSSIVASSSALRDGI